MKRRDFLLVLGIVAAMLLAFLVQRALLSPGANAWISVSGQQVMQLPLAEDGQHQGDGALGSYQVVIESGMARMQQSTCPDQLCVHQGAIHQAGQSIVCLPNQVLIQISGAENDAPDAIVY